MKRRNADCGKIRRPIKRNKITEGIYGSTFVYVKFLLVWALVLMADFILEFRFEYLWPFWLLLRSVYDSFKYQGLAFSVFFVCVAVTSDVVCYLFIPVQWLFFCASTYVWVQYVWHTERGICLPTVSLWLLFVYIEASIRLRDIKSFPFNMDLGRPFAAHCIGYPVVTLGFGFKSYISYRFRLRKQKDVEKENEFYIQLLQQALPTELQNVDKQKALPNKTEESISNTLATTSSTPQQNGSLPSAKQDKKASPATSTGSGSTGSNSSHSNSKHNTDSNNTSNTSNSSHNHHSHHQHHHHSSSTSHPDKDLTTANNSSSNSGHHTVNKPSNKQNNISSVAVSPHSCIEADTEYIYNSLPPPKKRNMDDFNEESLEKERNERNTANKTSYKQQYGGGGGRNQQQNSSSTTAVSKLNNHKDTNTATSTPTTTATSTHSSSAKKGKNNNAAAVYSNNKDEALVRLESDVKKLKADLQSSRNTEQELRSQINRQSMEDKSAREELLQLRQDNENLQNKLHNLVTCRQQDKQTLCSLEKKLQEEKKSKQLIEQQLAQEKKIKKEEAAKAQANRGECSDICKTRRRDLENDLKQSRRDSMIWEDQIRQLERETQTLRQYKEAQNETEVLMSALAAMQDKNAHLENSLSAENRLKQDLFSALGEAKRQIEIHQGLLAQKELEIAELKVKIAEVISLVPTAANFSSVSASSQASSPLQFSGNYTPPTLSVGGGAPGSFTPPQAAATFTPPPPSPTEDQEVVANSSLNPNASDYTPKMSQ